jgi:colanic acid biosynthesis glycosyl transferase WcaI
VDTDFVQPGNRRNDFSSAHGLDNRFVVLYAGNVGLTQSFETILAAAQNLARLPDLHFMVVGGGARWAWLKEELARRGATNITLLPYQPRALVPHSYASSDLCLVPLKRGTAQETFPSKVYTIMAAGRPVLASTDADSELAWVVGQADCGWAVPSDDAEALAAAIEYAYHHRAESQQRGRRGRDYVVAHHSRQAIAQQYHNLISEVLSQSR